MKKKILVGIILTISCLSLIGCGSDDSKQESKILKKPAEVNRSRFHYINADTPYRIGGDNADDTIHFFVDHKTNIVYMQLENNKTEAVTPLLNKDGKPMNLNEFNKMNNK